MIEYVEIEVLYDGDDKLVTKGKLYFRDFKVTCYRAINKVSGEIGIVCSEKNVFDPKNKKLNVLASSEQDKSTGCLAMTINGSKKTSKIGVVSKYECGPDIKSGDQIMDMIDAINKHYGVKKSTLKDHSHVFIDEFSIPLSLISIIKHEKTWYMKYGFDLTHGKHVLSDYLELKVVDVLDAIQLIKGKFKKQLIDKFGKIMIKNKKQKFNKFVRRLIKKDILNFLYFEFLYYLPINRDNNTLKILSHLKPNLIMHHKIY